MAVEVLTRTVTLKVMECATCGLPFALPQTLYDSCYQDGGFWSCPLGHRRGWEKGERARQEEDLKAQLAKAAKQLEMAESNAKWYKDARDDAERRVIAQKGVAAKLRKRVSNGCCPVCRRNFASLQSHMRTKHPDYATEEPK